jgi:hypothetical protein
MKLFLMAEAPTAPKLPQNKVSCIKQQVEVFHLNGLQYDLNPLFFWLCAHSNAVECSSTRIFRCGFISESERRIHNHIHTTAYPHIR